MLNGYSAQQESESLLETKAGKPSADFQESVKKKRKNNWTKALSRDAEVLGDINQDCHKPTFIFWFSGNGLSDATAGFHNVAVPFPPAVELVLHSWPFSSLSPALRGERCSLWWGEPPVPVQLSHCLYVTCIFCTTWHVCSKTTILKWGEKKDAGVPELHYVMVDLRSKPITEEQDEFHRNNAGKILRFPQKRPEGFTAAATLIRCIRGMTLRVYFLNLYLLCHLKPVGQPKSAAYCTGAGGD